MPTTETWSCRSPELDSVRNGELFDTGRKDSPGIPERSGAFAFLDLREGLVDELLHASGQKTAGDNPIERAGAGVTQLVEHFMGEGLDSEKLVAFRWTGGDLRQDVGKSLFGAWQATFPMRVAEQMAYGCQLSISPRGIEAAYA
jgi:hypothetical protein